MANPCKSEYYNDTGKTDRSRGSSFSVVKKLRGILKGGKKMGTAIIIVILTIVIIFSVRGSIKHTKGEGGCCGGGGTSEKIKKQKLQRVVAIKRIEIEGIKCENCKRMIENALNSLNQVNAKVDLKRKEAVVKLGEDVSDEILINAIESRGYKVISIERKEK